MERDDEKSPGEPALREGQGRGPAKVGSFERRRTVYAWIFLLPALVIIAFVALYPLAYTFYLSFTDARLGSAEPAKLVGLRNYADLMKDGYFLASVGVTLSFTLLTVLLELGLGLIIALVVNSRFRGRSVVRAAMLIPWAVPTVISAEM